MRLIFILAIVILPLLSPAQLTNAEVRGLKSGRLPDDTSYVYSLPYSVGKKFLFIQGANSMFSHKSELAYDFKMKKGSSIYAARGGVVTSLRSDSDEGGLKPENLSDGNFVVIEHVDGSRAYYWHLEKDGIVKSLGDSVLQGEIIGRSGNTGYSAFPHLHFQVVDQRGRQILVRFRTKEGNRYLVPGRSYKRPREIGE